jgi:hypothetical protein
LRCLLDVGDKAARLFDRRIEGGADESGQQNSASFSNVPLIFA